MSSKQKGHSIPSYIPEDARVRIDDMLRWLTKHTGYHTAKDIAKSLGLGTTGDIYTRLERMRLWGLISQQRTYPYRYAISDWGTKYVKDQKII